MTAPNRPPLWWAMQGARDAVIAAQHPFAREEQCLAAEIRALRDWLVPETEPPIRNPHESGSSFAARRREYADCQRLRALLTTEADRAERGEVEP